MADQRRRYGRTGRRRPVEQLVAEWVLRQLSGPALSAALAAATGEDHAERELLAALQVEQDRLDELGGQPAPTVSKCLVWRVDDPLSRSSRAGWWRAPAAC